MRDNDIGEHLQCMLPYGFNLRIRGGATATEYVDEMRELTGTIRDPNEEELSAARKGRRIRQPGQDPKGFNICIMFWNGNDCAEVKTAKGGSLYKSVPPTAGAQADAARLKRILEVTFDAGYLFGPARAETWGIVDDLDQLISMSHKGFAPPNFQYCDGTRFWKGMLQANDGWHLVGGPERDDLPGKS